MDISSPAPFANAELLGSFVQRRVRLVGHVEALSGPNVIQLRAADDGIVTVKLAAPSSFDRKFVCVEGTVESPDTVIEESHADFGDNFDLGKFNELCKLSNGQFQPIFS